MVSKLEDVLLRYSNGKARIRELLLEHLDDRSLRSLRLVSRVLHNLINRYAGRVFERLFVPVPWVNQTETSSLQAVAPSCRVLDVKVGHRKASTEQRSSRLLQKRRPDSGQHTVNEHDISARDRWQAVRQALRISSRMSSSASAILSFDQNSTTTRSTISSLQPPSSKLSNTSARHVWISILSQCQQLQTITISTNGEPGWPGKTHIEDDLMEIRVALESVQLPHIRCVRLTPVHAMGIIHLRWSGFGVFSTVTVKPFNTWSNLHTLDVQLENPLLAKHKLSERQQVMFKKVLYDYLRSFSDTLKCLRFIWLYEDGPSPMTLDLEPGLEGRQAIIWTALEEVQLGYIALPHRTIRLLPERVRKASVRLKTLRSTHRHSRVRFADDDAWVDVLLDYKSRGVERGNVFDRASSVYSQ